MPADALQPQKTPGHGGYNNKEPNGDAFVTVLNPSGGGVLYSTYFGTTADDFGYAVAVDSGGNICLGLGSGAGSQTGTFAKITR